MKKTSIIFFALIFVSCFVKAQDDKYSATVVVVGNFQPTVSDASKINFSPSIKDSIRVQPDINYFINSKRHETSFETEPIKPVRLVDEKITKLYNFLAKAGFGTYKTPYAEMFFSNQRSRKWSNSIHLKHISSTGSIESAGYPGWSDNIIEANSGRYFKNSALWGGLNFSRNVVHYYGFNPDTVYNDILMKIDKSIIKQRFIYADAFIKFVNINIDSSSLDYKFRLDYKFTSDYFKRKEQDIEFTGFLSKNLELSRITKSQNLGIKINADFVAQDILNVQNHNNSLISLQPFLDTKFGFFDINIGGNASITADSISYLYFYPQAEIHFRLIRNILDIYGGYNGNINRNDFRSLSKENPFVSSNIPSSFSYNKSDFYGGVNARISKNIDFFGRLSNKNIDNMHFFVREYNNFSPAQKWLNRFIAVYDDVRILKVSSGLAYQQQERLKISLGGSWNEYYMTDEMQPWHKSPYEIYLSAKYNIQNKIIANAEVFYFGPSYGLSTLSYNSTFIMPHKIEGYTDINLSLEYRYSKVLSGFVNLYNIGATRFEKWLDYPSRRFSLLAGVTYGF